jgi:hypothetical protein
VKGNNIEDGEVHVKEKCDRLGSMGKVKMITRDVQCSLHSKFITVLG